MVKEVSIFNVPSSLVSRHHDEKHNLPEYRTEFMRDRDRLMYATAFRRLAGKTQIYTVGRDDHKKNRLTHTLEVAQIARTIAIALGLNADLAEAIAIAHDFGHTPFGHAGERMLHAIMIPDSEYVKNSPFYQKSFDAINERFERESKENEGHLDVAFGFKHNIQSVRVCGWLENTYRGQNDENIGLNLTNYTLYGMMTHSSLKYKKVDETKLNTKKVKGEEYPNYQNFFEKQTQIKGTTLPAWSFEAFIVKLADDIAQWHHDLEDAMREGVLPISRICETIQESLGGKLTAEELVVLDQIKSSKWMDRKCLAELSHIVVNTLVNDVVEVSKRNFEQLETELEEKKVTEAERLFKEYDSLGLSIDRENVITLSEGIKQEKFKGIIRGSVHHSLNVERMNEKGKYIIRKLFEAYCAHPQQLPDGPILHLLVEMKRNGYENLAVAKENGIGEARLEFEKIMRNPNIYQQCLLMRRICDHIASMTDHYAIEEFNNLYG